MTYSAGSTILASDFNNFAGQVREVLGDTHSNATSESVANFGYGQGSLVSNISAGNTITAAQWTSLLENINRCANHQGTGVSIPTSVSAGSTITILSGLTTALTNIRNNRLSTGPGSTTTTSGGTRLNSSRTTGWSGQIDHEWVVSFPSYNCMRYFFNTGGQIAMSASRSGGSGTSINSDWSSLLSNMGTILFNHTRTLATGVAIDSSIGFYNLTTSFQTILQRFGSGAYTSNNYTLRARLNNPLGSSASQLIFRAEFNSNKFTDGTFRNNVDDVRATGPVNSIPSGCSISYTTTNSLA